MMTGFSIQQPWNELVVADVKTIEVRRYRRGPLLPMTMAIHAGLEFDQTAPLPVCIAAAKWGAGTRARRGAITGVATLVEIFAFTPVLWRDLYEQHLNAPAWYRDGLWGWRFADAVRLLEPVRCPGSLGFWSVPPHIEARVRAMIADSRAQTATSAADPAGQPETEAPENAEIAEPGAEAPKRGSEDAL